MIYTNAVVQSVSNTTIMVENRDTGSDVLIYLPDIMSRLPAVGDQIVYATDDVEEDQGHFIAFLNTAPMVIGDHRHQLLSDETVDSMPLSETQKADLKTKRTGGML